MSQPIVIDFFYGLGSRYSYLASTQIAALEAETGCAVRWRPLAPASLTDLRGRSPFGGEALSGQYEWAYRQSDAEAWADYYGVPYREPRNPTVNSTLPAHADAAATRFGKVAEVSRRLFRAHFADGVPIDADLCVDLAASEGIDADAFRAALDDPATAAQLDADARNAHRRGAFGVPTFFVGETMFWGNDRLPLLRHHLAKRSANG